MESNNRVIITMAGPVNELQSKWNDLYSFLSRRYKSVDFEYTTIATRGIPQTRVTFYCHPQD